MKRVLVVGVLLGLVPAAAMAQSAKPDNPSAFAKQVVVPDAQAGGAGDMVPDTAKSSPGALANAIAGAKDAFGSSPTPPGRD